MQNTRYKYNICINSLTNPRQPKFQVQVNTNSHTKARQTYTETGQDGNLSPRKLLQTGEKVHATLLFNKDMVKMRLTWTGIDIDIVEAVAIDGILDTCSVDNKSWRNNDGDRLISSCSRSCSPLFETPNCVEIDIGEGYVYDLLLTKRDGNRDDVPYALRVRAPWVFSSSCLVSQGSSTICGGPDITWHGCSVSIGDPAHVGTMVPIDATSIESTDIVERIGLAIKEKRSGHVAFESKGVRHSVERADLVYLSLDRGMRITRIVTATTFSPTAAQKLSKATSRDEIMQICVRQHPDECMLYEVVKIPSVFQDVKMGWGFQQPYGSPVRAKAGVPGSILWVADLQRTPDCHISVGSWLMGSMPLNTQGKISALFTQSASRVCAHMQPVVLVRPGFSWPALVSGSATTQWSITFVEMQNTDELGVPTKRH
jgi:hypothetical protein